MSKVTPRSIPAVLLTFAAMSVAMAFGDTSTGTTTGKSPGVNTGVKGGAMGTGTGTSAGTGTSPAPGTQPRNGNTPRRNGGVGGSYSEAGSGTPNTTRPSFAPNGPNVQPTGSASGLPSR